MTITKFRVGMAVLFVLGIAALFAIVGKAQGPSLPPGEYDLEAGQYVFNVPDLASTDTPVPGPTGTPVSPTDTPVPGAHNDVEWHPVSADVAHAHNADPNSLNHIFGPPGAWHNGQEISYPWQTWHGLDSDPLGPSSGIMENDIKHEGYKWFAEDFGDCGINFYAGADRNCITAARILYHAVGGAVGAGARLHGFSFEARICTPDGSVCGIVRTGGHADFGPLSVAADGTPINQGAYVPLPNDPPEFANKPTVFNPYKHHAILGGSENTYDWHSSARYGWNQVALFAFSNRDDWQGIDPNDPSRVELVCPAFDCELNHSRFFVYVLRFNQEGRLQDNIDGVIDGVMNFSGFTDRQGHLVPTCAPLGPDCIPLILENVPANDFAHHNRPNIFPSWVEYDISPPGEFWIEFPN